MLARSLVCFATSRSSSRNYSQLAGRKALSLQGAKFFSVKEGVRFFSSSPVGKKPNDKKNKLQRIKSNEPQ